MKYRIRTEVEHDGSIFLPGAAIDLDEGAALPLLAVEAIGPEPEPAKPGTKTRRD